MSVASGEVTRMGRVGGIYSELLNTKEISMTLTANPSRHLLYFTFINRLMSPTILAARNNN